MVLFRDLWKKYSTLQQNSPRPLHRDTDAESKNTEAPTPLSPETLRPLQEHLQEIQQADTVLANLRAIKQLIEKPKEASPELRFFEIKKHLGASEVYETLRQERWHEKIKCPNCGSNRLKRVLQTPPRPVANHRYQCLSCGHEFNDDSGTPIEHGSPSIYSWIECWYLMRCTDSLSYIAHKLNIDLTIIEVMVIQLQRLFNSDKPLSRLDLSKELSNQSKMQDLFKQEVELTYERLGAQLARMPLDTAEHRRRETIRRHGELTPDLTISPHKPGSKK